MTKGRTAKTGGILNLMERIYNPCEPNLNGYRLYHDDPSFSLFLKRKLFKWYSESLWSIYGRDRIVAVYLRREQSVGGMIENWMARRILIYLFGG